VSGVRIAAWEHAEGRRGFEVARLEPLADGGWRIDGHSTGEDEGLAWGMHYVLRVDAAWATRSLEAAGFSEEGAWGLSLAADGAGAWERDGAPLRGFEGCLDVDMVSTVLTNTLAVRRLDLEIDESGTLDAVWIGTPAGREVERMPQRYTRVGIRAYRFEVVGGDFAADLEIDEFGLVAQYPGLARRVA
jgi:uncharacterized protein